MKSLYRRQFAMMASVLLVAFLMLGGAFITMSYQYIVTDKQESMESNAKFIADFTASYLAGNTGGIRDQYYQLYIASLANISGGTVLLAENTGEIVFAATGDNIELKGLVGGRLPVDLLEQWVNSGSTAQRTNLGGLLPDKSFVAVTPVLQSNPYTGATYQQGLVLVVNNSTALTAIWNDLASIFTLTAMVVLLLAAVISMVTSRFQTKPLNEMAEVVRRFGQGELDARVKGYESRKDEVGELAEAFNAMAGSIAKSEQQRSEFIANVSHELKTPMTTIAGFADGILDGTIPREREADALTTISSETRRLSRLVRRMLEVSRLQSQGEGVTAQERFDVSEVLLRVLVSLEGKINDRGLDVETNLPDGAVMVWGDPDAITQVCYNLLDNAIKFADSGSALSLRIQVKGEKAYVSVQNRGETIPPEELDQIFDRFHKADRSRSEDREGVGLGLYIVKTLLNAHRENITVTSAEGVTTFTFTLTIA
ncbi:MAG: HAMP domain-containing histidine kinase [Oscillospiraceae bacterium]|nr:HAMP domain-containing histidine kinase [Oscillospiraceae bacterium]